MYRHLLFTLLLFVISCSSNENSLKESLKESNNDNKSDTLKNSYAEAFRIIEHGDFTEIQVLNPENNEIEFRYSYGKSNNTKIEEIDVDLNRVVALSSTHIGMLEELGLVNKIVGISDEKYVCSSLLKDQVDKGFTESIGDIGYGDVEAYISVNPDIIIYSGFDTKAPILQKLKSAGLKTFTNYDWKETHPLGRAEWLKVLGVIFNKRDKAKKLFTKIESDYLNLVRKVKKLSTEDNVLAGTMYGDIFNAPAGDSYMAKLLKDANLNYKYQDSKGTGSISLSLEEVISDNRKTEIWLNVAAQNKDDVLEMSNRFELLESLMNNRVYSYYHKVNCFWEKSAIMPHLLLQDICKIAHPTFFEDVQFNFYQKLN